MKNLILILFFLVTCIIPSCKTVTSNRETDCVTILLDVTDSFPDIVSVNAKSILPVLRLSHDSLFGARVTIIPITNFRFNYSKTFSIPSENFMEHNEFDRKEVINEFKRNLDSGLTSFNKKVPGTEGSYIFFAIANALNDLTDCKECDTKKLILFTDCRENTKVFNSYDKESIKFIQQYPEKISALLDRNWPILKPLEGVQIFIEHHPTSQTEDDIFYIMSSFMKSYYEAKGAIVTLNSLPTY